MNDVQVPFREHPIDWTDAKISRLWSYYSRTSRFSDSYFSRVYGSEILRSSRLNIRTAANVLDFGCGPGYIWDHLREMSSAWKYWGVDFSMESVDRLSARAAAAPRFLGAVAIVSLPTELPDDFFDTVLLIEVVEHLRDEHLFATLREVRRVTKQGGAVLITTPNMEDLDGATKFCPDCGAIFHEWQHLRSWTVETLRECMSAQGFDLRFAKTMDFSANSLVKRAFRRVQRWRGRWVPPHLLAVFEKR